MRTVRVSDGALEAGPARIERELVQLGILQGLPGLPPLGLATDQASEVINLARWRGLRLAEEGGLEATAIDELWPAHLRVSVIVANHNYGHYLDEAIRSVLAQSYLPDELILSDDASTDDSPAIMESYRRANPDVVRVNLNDTNMGIRAHFNKVIAMATGDLVVIIGADNRIPVDYVESQLAILASDEQVGLAYTDFALFGSRAKNDYDRMLPAFRGPRLPDGVFLSNFPEYSSESAALLREGHNFIHGSTMYRKRVWEQVGGYGDRSNGPEDMTLFQAMIGTGLVAKKVRNAALEYRQHSAEQANYQFNYFGELERLRREKATDLETIRQLAAEVEKQAQIIEELDVVVETARNEKATDLETIRQLAGEGEKQAQTIEELDGVVETARNEVARVNADRDHRWHLSREIDAVLSSRSWRFAAPLRLPGRILGNRPVRRMADAPENAVTLQKKLDDLRNSRSWRLTRFLRRR